MTITTALTITPPPSEVTQLLTASDDSDGLVIRHGTTTISEGDGVDFSLTAPSQAVPLEILDYEDSQGCWTINATLDDGNGQPVDWTRQDDRCSYAFSSTGGSYVQIAVTATNGSSAARRRIFFIKVKPEGDRPDL